MALGPFFKDIDGLPTWLNALLGFFVLPAVIIIVGRFSETLGMVLIVAFGTLFSCLRIQGNILAKAEVRASNSASIVLTFPVNEG
jgi:hypothetical protein